MATETMRAAVFREPGRVEIEQVPIRKCGPDGLILKVMACGLSRLDSIVYRFGHSRVTAPRILGHEVVGEVVEVGDNVLRFSPGDRIAVGLTMPGRHDLGYAQPPSDVPEEAVEIGLELDGGLAELMTLDNFVVKHGPVVKLPSTLGWADATLIEPLSRCSRALAHCRMIAGKSVVVLGCGLTGVLAGVAAALQEARLVILVDVSKDRLELAKRLGFEHVLQGSGPELVQEVLRRTNGRGADIVLSTATVPHVQEEAMEIVARGGAVSILSRLPDSARPISILSNKILDNEIRIIGTRGANSDELRAAAELLRKSRFSWSKLNTDVFPLAKITEAIARSEELGSLHVIVLPQA